MSEKTKSVTKDRHVFIKKF